jgi:hypothetical protein
VGGIHELVLDALESSGTPRLREQVTDTAADLVRSVLLAPEG